MKQKAGGYQINQIPMEPEHIDAKNKKPPD
jgi:hypothetical protein